MQARSVAGRIYEGLAGLHRRWRARRVLDSPPPVLVVGSLRAGGSGKSPALLWIASRRTDLAILLHPTPDEQPQLARRFPGRVFAARDLLEAWRDARAAGFQGAVCDGGFQDPVFARSPSLVFWEGWPAYCDLLPLGAFRERGRAMDRAGAVLAECGTDLGGKGDERGSALASARAARPVFRYAWAFGPACRIVWARGNGDGFAAGTHVVPGNRTGCPGGRAESAGSEGGSGTEDDRSTLATAAKTGGLSERLVPGDEVLVASGIARPERWERDVAQAGFRIVDAFRTGDHGRFDPQDIRRMAEAHPGVSWLITEKDIPRWPVACRSPGFAVHALPRRFRPQDPRGLLQWIDGKLPASRRMG